MKKIILVAVVAAGLSACSPYAANGPFGGVSASQLTADTYRITASGNSFTSNERLEDFVLMKAAETAKAGGHTHFAFVSDASRTIRTRGGPTSAHVYGSTAFLSSAYSKSRKGSRKTVVQVFTVPSGQTAPAGSFEADEIIRYVGPRLKLIL